ncbi:BPTI/Kunitz inhibitor domain-containing protein [Caenorhabditis elegans]|uniref:BPTI/Kunitz inhibitor domain-containing protein n=1 Tax=Caenorhabditis elegans TaxID=6239 RepID=Q20008_CAEEL|nr:BPTI/Kunitz inhibitor domain-containing protein [Caenorhabditis elegans]CAA98461.2 BPTI/Kunitz inhibitor domain-containing protein [Caenorhabditis elegans]|eukprot:NP_505943.2 Protease Inhibitor I2 (Two) [Caenorhabditis elegans]
MALRLAVILSLLSFTAAQSTSVDCFAARDSGNTCAENSSSRMFYYLPRLGTCQPFMYQGCGGNSNRFSSAQECRSACTNAQAQRDSESSDETVQMKSACSATYDTDHLTPVRCSAGANTCPQGHNCIQSFCCPTSNYLCNLTYDSGKFAVGGEKSDKYFWVPKYTTCMRFSFYGTLGNANNFPNYNSCMATCGNQTRTSQ